MFRRCVASQVQRLLFGLRLSPSIPPVSSGVFGVSQALANFHSAPPMACDILSSDLNRTGPATGVRQVRQQVSLVVPNRSIRIRTSSWPREVCQQNIMGRVYHQDTVKGKMNTSVPDSSKRLLQHKTRQSLLELVEDHVIKPGIFEAKQVRNQIRVKLRRKSPHRTRRKQAPKDVPSSSDSEEVESMHSQKPRNPINHWVAIILEKSKRVRAELLEGKNADLERVKSPEDEAKILHYKNHYMTQIQKNTSGMRTRTITDKQDQNPPIATLSHTNCFTDSKTMGEVKEIIESEKEVLIPLTFSKDEGPIEVLDKVPLTPSIAPSPPQKAPLRQNQCSEYSMPRAKAKYAKFGEAEKEYPEPRVSLDNFRAREKSLLSCIKRETISRWRAHRLVRPFEPMPYQFTRRSQNVKKEMGQPEIINLVSDDQLNSKAIHGEVKSILMPSLNSPNWKSDMKIIYSKNTLQDNHAAIFNQLKNDIHRRLWELSDEESFKKDWVTRLNDKDEWQFRVAEMISKCFFLVHNKMMNEPGNGKAYQEKDKHVGEIAEEFFRNYKQVHPDKNQEICESSCKNESGRKSGGTGQIDQSNCPERVKKSKDPRRKTNDGMFRSGLSNLNNKLCSIAKQIDDIAIQCQHIKSEIEKKTDKEKPKQECAKNDIEREFRDEEQKEPIKGTNDNGKLNSNKGPAEEQIQNITDLKGRCVKEEFRRKCAILELTELIQRTKCSQIKLKRKLEEMALKKKRAEKMKCAKTDLMKKFEEFGLGKKCAEKDEKDIHKGAKIDLGKKCEEMDLKKKYAENYVHNEYAENDKRTKKKRAEIDLWKKCAEKNEKENKECEEILLKEKCKEIDLKKKCKESALTEKCEEVDLRRKSSENEKEKMECAEMDLREKYAEKDDKDKKECAEMDLREKCEEMALRKKCEEMDLNTKGAENDKKTNEKFKTDDESELNNCEYEGLMKKLLQLLNEICEEDDPKTKSADENKENGGTMKEETDKCVAVELSRKFKFLDLKSWNGTTDRQKTCTEDKLRRLESKKGLGQCVGEEHSMSDWAESLSELRKKSGKGNMDENRVFPGFKGIFRLPTFANGCSQDDFCDPITSVCPKLKRRDDRERSFGHRQSLVCTGSSFRHRLHPERFSRLQSSFLQQQRYPDLTPLTTNGLRVRLRKILPFNLPFLGRNFNEDDILF